MCPKQCMFIQGNYLIEFKILWRAKLKCLTVKFFFFFLFQLKIWKQTKNFRSFLFKQNGYRNSQLFNGVYIKALSTHPGIRRP